MSLYINSRQSQAQGCSLEMSMFWFLRHKCGRGTNILQNDRMVSVTLSPKPVLHSHRPQPQLSGALQALSLISCHLHPPSTNLFRAGPRLCVLTFSFCEPLLSSLHPSHQLLPLAHMARVSFSKAASSSSHLQHLVQGLSELIEDQVWLLSCPARSCIPLAAASLHPTQP